MFLHNFWSMTCVLTSVQLIGINAYPMLNIPLWFGSTYESRYKKNDMGFPQADADVIELEHLREINGDAAEATDAHIHSHQIQPAQQQEQQKTVEEGNTSDTSATPSFISATSGVGGNNDALIKHADLLPELERELELLAVVTPQSTISVSSVDTKAVPTEADAGQPEQEPLGQGTHRPPMLPHNVGVKMTGHQNQAEESAAVVGGAASPLAPAKPFYGAARLAFGQNPEGLPTSSTTSSTTTSTTTTTTTVVTPTANEESIVTAPDVETGPVPASASAFVHENGMRSKLEHDETKPVESAIDEHTKEFVASDVAAVDEVKTALTAARRSVALMSPKTAENLLSHHDGRYSSFDMAQYIFWTGDEAGVAHAVEEFIEQGLMPRENALKFLRDIRLGIEYLQNSYANRVNPEEIRQNNVKKSYPSPSTTASTTTTTTTSTTSPTTTDKPFPYIHIERILVEQENNANRPNANHGTASMWNKLQELNNESEGDVKQDLSDYDESTGRAKIAEFLYTEYTLEEIIYKLAKVMFTQSLAHGSNEAQLELQKLTDFLEREGNRGVIPLDLQKKVLHVLLSALSDTLREHPGLLPAARLNLANPYNRLPIHSYGTLK